VAFVNDQSNFTKLDKIITALQQKEQTMRCARQRGLELPLASSQLSPGMGPVMSPVMSTGMSSVMGPEMSPGMSPGMGPVMSTAQLPPSQPSLSLPPFLDKVHLLPCTHHVSITSTVVPGVYTPCCKFYLHAHPLSAVNETERETKQEPKESSSTP
jgi:hypothetical protein